MGGYADFAYVYDELTDDINYKQRTENIAELFKKYDRLPTLLLDLACGTGGFSLEFAEMGMQVIGVDISEDMLSIARQKCEDENREILFLNQSAQSLELYGTVDGAVCCLDSLNHITDFNDFKTAVEKVSLFLEPDRLFIFDVNSEYKQREILGNNTFIKENEGVFCSWQNSYDAEKHLTCIDLDIFCETDDGTYIRTAETFFERVYTKKEIDAVLSKAGFKTEAVLDGDSFGALREDSQRVLYVVRKVK